MPALAINSKCYGCAACSNVCPKKCIEMKLNENGEWRPFVNLQNCIECQKCVKVCPALKTSQLREPLKTYAMTLTDTNRKDGCASGGAARMLYEYALSTGKVVYGCDFDNEFVLRMRSANSIDQIDTFRNSKYTFCRMERTYKEIENYLKDKTQVLFIGTSCQVNALINYLGGERTGLLTIDLLCHGVPPEQYFKDYIELQKTHLKCHINQVIFRGDKKTEDYYMRLYEKEKCVYKLYAREDLFFAGYVNYIMFEEKCYDCPFAQEKRVSDLTIGDWWGATEITGEKLSLVFANTEKGNSYLQNIVADENVEFEEHSLIEAINSNEQLRGPSEKPPFYEDMRECYRNQGFEIMADQFITPLIQQYKKRKRKEEIQRILYIPRRMLGKIKRMVKRI